MTRIIRTIVGVLAGMLLISLLVEALEFGLVTAINGQITTEPAVYFAIRNQFWFLGLKLIYNSLAAIVGGLVAARIARYAPVKHGIALALLQTLSFLFALTQPEMSQWTPVWMWITLILLSLAGILFGAHLQVCRQASC